MQTFRAAESSAFESRLPLPFADRIHSRFLIHWEFPGFPASDFPRLLRHLSLQYTTSFQFFSHFFLQVNGRLQTGHVLLGRFDFSILFIRLSNRSCMDRLGNIVSQALFSRLLRMPMPT